MLCCVQPTSCRLVRGPATMRQRVVFVMGLAEFVQTRVMAREARRLLRYPSRRPERSYGRPMRARPIRGTICGAPIECVGLFHQRRIAPAHFITTSLGLPGVDGMLLTDKAITCMSTRSPPFGRLMEGLPTPLIRNGPRPPPALRTNRHKKRRFSVRARSQRHQKGRNSEVTSLLE